MIVYFPAALTRLLSRCRCCRLAREARSRGTSCCLCWISNPDAPKLLDEQKGVVAGIFNVVSCVVNQDICPSFLINFCECCSLRGYIGDFWNWSASTSISVMLDIRSSAYNTAATLLAPESFQSVAAGKTSRRSALIWMSISRCQTVHTAEQRRRKLYGATSVSTRCPKIAAATFSSPKLHDSRGTARLARRREMVASRSSKRAILSLCSSHREQCPIIILYKPSGCAPGTLMPGYSKAPWSRPS